MLFCMRTTLVIEDSLFHKAKKRAVESGTTLSDLANSALRVFLMGTSAREEQPFMMPVFGSGKKFHQTPADFAKLRDEGR